MGVTDKKESATNVNTDEETASCFKLNPPHARLDPTAQKTSSKDVATRTRRTLDASKSIPHAVDAAPAL